MKKTEENQNQCILFNRSGASYRVVELGSIEHLAALREGYEYRGPVYVAKLTESITMREANELFMKSI